MSDEDPQYEYKKRLHSAYSEQRSKADQIAFEIGGRYERMLSLVAGGALVVSLTFIEKIAPSPLPGTRWIALLSWGCLGTAVIACLYAITSSQKAQQKKIENMDSEILQGLNPDDPRYKDLDVTSNPFAKYVRLANDVSLWNAVAGLVFLVLFAFLNFPTDKKHEQTTSPKTQPAAATGQAANQLLRPNQRASSATSAATTGETGEMTMSQKPTIPPASSPPPPPKPMQETRGSYIPTQNQVAPPPPPPPPAKPAETPPAKDG